MKLLAQNRKLKKTSKITGKKTLNFDLPAGKTCPFAGDCKKFCYAKKGAFIWPNVKIKHEENFKATMDKDFTVNMIQEIIESQAEMIRIHSSGDFYSMVYLTKWLLIADSLPHVTFYAYTKSIPYFENVKLPENFKVIFSYGGTKDELINPEIDRHAKVFDIVPSEYSYTNDNDHIALAKNHRIGLALH